MRMKSLFTIPAVTLLTAISLTLTIPGDCKDRDAFCSWIGGPAQTDGKLDEWQNMPTTFFDDERLVVGVGNDSASLYIFLRTDERRLINTIRRLGIRLCLDPKGKKKKDLCFHYRGGPTMPELIDAGLIDTNSANDRMDKEHQRMAMAMPPETENAITLTDKKLELRETIPIDGTFGPIVEYAFDHGFCVYEISIPLQDHLVDYYGFDARPGQKICIGLKWGGMPERDMMENGPSGGISGIPGVDGGGRGGMGGRPGGNDGGGRGGVRQMQPPDEKEFWIKTELAAPPPDKD